MGLWGTEPGNVGCQDTGMLGRQGGERWGEGHGQERRGGNGASGWRRYLSVREGVVVGPHFWVHVLQVPFEASALQPLA